jgi:hypothetical protein
VLEISLGTITNVLLRLFRLRQGSQDMRSDDLLALIPARYGQSNHAFSSDFGVCIPGSEGSTSSVPDLECIGLAVGDSSKEMRGDNKVTAGHDWTRFDDDNADDRDALLGFNVEENKDEDNRWIKEKGRSYSLGDL